MLVKYVQYVNTLYLLTLRNMLVNGTNSINRPCSGILLIDFYKFCIIQKYY